MTRKITYKEPTANLERISAPTHEHSRASIGMEKFLGEYYFLSIEKLIPFKGQARVSFDSTELNQLAETIRVHGIRQPLSVVKSDVEQGKYEVVSGERRLRAAKLVGLERVPCIIMESTAHKDELALVENIQRADLHLIELARGLDYLIKGYGWGGQTEIEKRLGIPQSRISEALKLLNLSSEIQNLCIETKYTGRDNLLALLDLDSDVERRHKILSSKNRVITGNFSILRVLSENGFLKIQKNGLKKLDEKMKKSLKTELSHIVENL